MKTRDEVIAVLVARKTDKDEAAWFADAYLEYQQASENIAKNGVLVAHPRTGAPLANPYVKIRDGALKKLLNMRRVDATGLW